MQAGVLPLRTLRPFGVQAGVLPLRTLEVCSARDVVAMRSQTARQFLAKHRLFENLKNGTCKLYGYAV